MKYYDKNNNTHRTYLQAIMHSITVPTKLKTWVGNGADKIRRKVTPDKYVSVISKSNE